jgi:hypothetical protein
MKTAVCFFVAAIYTLDACAQDVSLDVTSSKQTNGYGLVQFTNASALGSKTTVQVKDEDVQGSPYFDEKWNRAIILLQNGQGVKVEKCRLDLYRNEAHYLDEAGIELTALSSIVQKIYFFDRKDTAKVSVVFQQVTGVDGGTATAFVQVINSGATALLKFTHVTIYNKGYDPSTGKDNYSFLSKSTYCILKNGVVTALTGLGEKAVMTAIGGGPAETAWLQQNKNRLHSEKDVTGFLNYYNGIK